MKRLIVGYGNPLRSDDGVGAYVAESIERLGLPDTEVCTVHQLHVDLVERWQNYDWILLVDASVEGKPVEIRELNAADGVAQTASHHANPVALYRLLSTVYDRRPTMKLCSIRGQNFDIGNSLSRSARERADGAVSAIRNLILGKE